MFEQRPYLFLDTFAIIFNTSIVGPSSNVFKNKPLLGHINGSNSLMHFRLGYSTDKAILKDTAFWLRRNVSLPKE